MATKWKAIPRKYTLKEAISVGPLAIQKMNTQERAELAQFLHNQFNLRLNTFLRSNTIPFALTKLARDYYTEVEVGNRKISVASRMGIDLLDNVVVTRGKTRMLNPSLENISSPHNALISYIILHQDFFKAKSSTVTGWRNIGLNEDIRLFGTKTIKRRVSYIDDSGKRRYEYRDVGLPKFRLTDAERRVFWETYEEIRKTSWTSINEYSSEEQQQFAALWMKGNFDHQDINEAYNSMLDYLDNRPRFLKEMQAGLSPEDDPFISQPAQGLEENGDTGDEFVW